MTIESQVIPYQAVSILGNGPALVLAPHADDEVLGCGGAIMRHIAAGDAVRVIVLTDGAGLLDDCDAERRMALIAQRRKESREAAKFLGYGEPLFWDYRDRELSCDPQLVQRLIDACREHSARWLYAPSIVEMHPDHRALAMAAVEAVRLLGEPVNLAMYEVGVPLPPNRLLDVSDLMERKLQAVHCFTSQLAEQAYDRHIEALNRFRTYTLPREIEAAEAYWVVNGTELRQAPLVIDTAETERRRRLELSADIQNPIRHTATQSEQEWRERYEAILASSSWRLTAPLRTLTYWWRSLIQH